MNRALVTLMTVLLASAQLFAEPLPKDEANLTGQFENGMKYIIRPNQHPAGRAEFFLHIRTGATNETAKQNGIAHFLEHMAFNGSKNFKPGELVPLLSKMGMQFGADTNAHTTFHETVYKLNLPDVTPETIQTGLTILSDYANGLDLSEKEIDAERGVILEEMRTGKSAGERLRKQMMQTVFADTKLKEHDVIGTEESIQSMPQSEFQDYWNTWYRPENMTLIIVGDVKADEVLPVAKEKLGAFTARAPARTPEKIGFKPTTESAAYVFTDPEQVAGEVSLFSMKPARKPMTTFDEYRQDVVEDIASWIVNRRFSDQINTGKAPFRTASATLMPFLNETIIANGDASGEPKDWNAILDATIAEISRAIDYGFAKSELELARAGMIAAAEQAVRTESSRDNSAIVNGLSFAVGMDLPILSAQQRLDLLKRVFETVTVDELHKSFIENFGTKNYIYTLNMPSGKADVSVPTNEELLSAAKAAWAKKTEPLKEKSLGDKFLASEPTPGKVASTEKDEELGLTTVVFENGVVMHHKFNDYRKDQVTISMSLPGGTIEETAETDGLSSLASLVLGSPATSKFTSTQVRDMLTGKNVRVGGGIGLDALTLSVSGAPKDLAFGLQLAHALLTDGRIEQSSVDEWKKNQLQQLRQMDMLPVGAMMDAQAELLYGGDLRFKRPTEAEIEKLDRSRAEAWFHRIASNAAIEVTVVGDLKVEEATDLVGRYIGSLPKRNQKFDALDSLRKINRGAGPYTRNATYDSMTPQAIAFAGFIGCEENEPIRRPLSLAAAILSERMIERIREKEQLAYSIGAQSRPGRGIAGTGMFMAGSMTDPAKADKLADTVIEMLKDFAANGPTEEELTTAKKQRATELGTQMKEPGFWASQLSELRYRKKNLADLKELPGVFDTFTTEQVKNSVATYMKDDRVIRFVVVPKKVAAPTTAPAEAK